ncbi:DEAD/DEAH box helicase, partial [Pseudomonas sp. FW305-BF6]|uniref:DEAD/DEAH box helicase n=1 Tax=Pseudomonas sp. FW305-BF6 TaxID=2070673 RepID=UPI000CC8D545
CPEDAKLTAKNFVGGTDYKRTVEKLKKQPHIVVGTTGRIKDLVNDNVLLVHTSKYLVVDEADLMLDMGFIHDVDQVASKMP